MAQVKLPIQDEDLLEDTSEPLIQGGPDEEHRPDVPGELNIMPLRDSVIYPMLIAPLSVSRESGIQLIDESIVGNNRVIGVVAQRSALTSNRDSTTFTNTDARSSFALW